MPDAELRLDLEQRLPRLMRLMLSAGVMAVAAGWNLTTDGFGGLRFLPFVLGIAFAVLSIRHAISIRSWYELPEKRALRPVSIAAALAMAACIAGFLSDRIRLTE